MAFYDSDVGVMIDAATVAARVRELGAQITKDYQGKDLTLSGSSRGASSSPPISPAPSICR